MWDFNSTGVSGITLTSGSRQSDSDGFSLVELMVATSILVFMLLMVVGMIQMTNSVWSRSNAQAQAFQGARNAFETINRSLGQSTLNTYWGYDSSTNPTRYERKSELHFIAGRGTDLGLNQALTHAVFFQSPLGYDDASGGTKLENLLNACGYYVQFGSDAAFRPAFFSGANKWRYRLFQFLQSTDELKVFQVATGRDWYIQPMALTSPPVQPLAENVLALVILPRRSTDGDGAAAVLCPDYLYDSRGGTGPLDPKRNQLPPLVDVALVAVDEVTALRWSQKYGQNQPPLGLETLFITASADTLTFDKFTEDLATLENKLRQEGANYRIFKTSVLLQESKWSEP